MQVTCCYCQRAFNLPPDAASNSQWVCPYCKNTVTYVGQQQNPSETACESPEQTSPFLRGLTWVMSIILLIVLGAWAIDSLTPEPSTPPPQLPMTDSTSTAPRLVMRGVRQQFGATLALDGVDLGSAAARCSRWWGKTAPARAR